MIVRFRVADVYKDAAILVTTDSGERMQRKKRMILAPGEMVNLSLPPEKLAGLKTADSILVRIEVPEA